MGVLLALSAHCKKSDVILEPPYNVIPRPKAEESHPSKLGTMRSLAVLGMTL